ncbi:fimbria/pilus periplasmic chaperone [Escherichia coli]|nr:fimbria/pilus periplasmic chaperone [Escherichia coli]
MATVLLLLLFACHSTVANAAVALGATRVIYPANQKQVLLPVTNNDPASVYLIQSWIENAGDQKDTQFVITPPLFSMQGKKENTLRIINATNHQLPGDRESLFWVNVKAIPAMEKDQKNENTLQLAIISRIKMFYRPTNLAMAPEEAPAMVLVKAPGADNVKIENQTGIHTDWRGYAILPFATEYRENRVALNANSLADNVELDETVITVIPTHGAIARATFNAQIGGKVLMTLKYGNKSVPFGAIVTHGENKNGSIVAENGQVYLTGLPQSGKLQVSWGKDKNSNCIVEYKLPEVSPGTLLNQQTAICR